MTRLLSCLCEAKTHHQQGKGKASPHQKVREKQHHPKRERAAAPHQKRGQQAAAPKGRELAVGHDSSVNAHTHTLCTIAHIPFLQSEQRPKREDPGPLWCQGKKAPNGGPRMTPLPADREVIPRSEWIPTVGPRRTEPNWNMAPTSSK